MWINDKLFCSQYPIERVKSRHPRHQSTMGYIDRIIPIEKGRIVVLDDWGQLYVKRTDGVDRVRHEEMQDSF